MKRKIKNEKEFGEELREAQLKWQHLRGIDLNGMSEYRTAKIAEQMVETVDHIMDLLEKVPAETQDKVFRNVGQAIYATFLGQMELNSDRSLDRPQDMDDFDPLFLLLMNFYMDYSRTPIEGEVC